MAIHIRTSPEFSTRRKQLFYAAVTFLLGTLIGVTTSSIADSAVTTAKIADNAKIAKGVSICANVVIDDGVEIAWHIRSR